MEHKPVDRPATGEASGNDQTLQFGVTDHRDPFHPAYSVDR